MKPDVVPAPLVGAPDDEPRVPVYRGMRRNDPDVMALIPRPVSKAHALMLIENSLQEFAAAARLLVKLPSGARACTPDSLTESRLQETRPVRRLGSYSEARSNLALHPVVRDGHARHIWAESQLELAHLEELDREGRFEWYDTQRMVLCWPVTMGRGARRVTRSIWHVPDVAAVDISGQRWLMDVKNRDAIDSSPHVRAQLQLTAVTCAYHGWGYRLLTDLSHQHRAELSRMRRHRSPLPPQLLASCALAILGTGATLGQIILDAGDGPGGYAVVMHLLATGQITVDLNQPLQERTSVRWRGVLR